MSADNLILILLTALLVLLFAGLWLVLRTARNLGQGESSAVLEERLQARQDEILSLQKQLEKNENRLREESDLVVALREKLSRQETLLQEARSQHDEKIRLLESARQQMSHEFKNLANEILEQKGQSFTEANRHNIEAILKPLGEKIAGFEKKVTETYDKESKERFSLTEEIRRLKELNSQISADAVNLTNALKGESKTRGIWGEIVLERVLEKSGLVKGREYEVQVSLKGEDGRLRQPDVIVHLPENKDVIIDSKVSLAAYEKYCSSDDEQQQKELLKQHVQSIRNHLRDLSGKAYDGLRQVRTLDYVLMFLPIEAAFTLAVQQDDKLFTDALEKNIILVGPSTLLATLRTIQNIWRFEHQSRNAMDIADRAGKLYDKFVGFTESLEEIGSQLQRTQVIYEKAHNQLLTGKGNVISHVDKLRKLGASARKKLPDKLLLAADDLADDEASEELPSMDESMGGVLPADGSDGLDVKQPAGRKKNAGGSQKGEQDGK